MEESHIRDQRKVEVPLLRSRTFWVTMLISAVVYAPSLVWSLGLDQNIFGTIGWLLLKGKSLYVEAWDVKPPNVFYTYALFESLFGNTDLTARASDYIATLLAAAAMFSAVRSRMQNASVFLQTWAPVVSSLLLVLTLLSLGLSDTAQTESYALCFLLIAPFLALKERNGWRFLAGVAIGIATFYKTTNGIFLVPIITEGYLIRRTRSIRGPALVLAGFVSWCMVQLLLLWLQGSLAAYTQTTMEVLVHHPSEVSTLRLFDLLRALWVSVDVWLILALAAYVYSALDRDATFRRFVRLPLLYLITGLVIVYLQNKGWGYHYVVTHPGLISLCGISFVYLVDRLRQRHSALLVSITLGVIILATLTVAPSGRRRLQQLASSEQALRDRTRYIESLGLRHTLYHPASSTRLMHYVEQRTDAKDTIWIMGEEPGVYWRTGRMPASKYVYTLLATSGVVPSDSIQTMVAGLVRSRPALVVISLNDTTNFRQTPETSCDLLRGDSRYLPLQLMLQEAYNAPDTIAGSYLAYNRKVVP